MKYAASFVCYIALFSTLVLLPPVVSGQTGKLKTKIQPPEAAVWVDGKYMGHADEFNGPGQTLALPAGEHEVKISLVYYQDHKTKVTIESNQTTVIKQQLRPSDEKRPNPPFAKAKLRCKPTAHAAVIVNGRFIGHCDEMNGPGQLLLLWPGTHTVEVQLNGYRTFKTSVEVDQSMMNKRIEIPAQLRPE
jgi:hypothetical protein